MYECNQATNVSASTLPSGTHSTKGCGSTMPDPKGLIEFSFINLNQIILFDRLSLYK
jgi:hypothetical protein